MEQSMKRLYKNIINNISVEENASPFMNYMVDRYDTAAVIRLAMHYFSFYESCTDEADGQSSLVEQAIEELNGIIEKAVSPKGNMSNLEEVLHQVDGLRNRIMKHMNHLTFYTDIFQNYEHVLNRIEYRFTEKELPEDEEFTRELLRNIFDTEDNVIINDKIKEVLHQLPVRITKQRYFDLVRGSIQEYTGAPSDTLDSYLYMLKTCAMIGIDGEMKESYPDLWDTQEKLGQLNYRDLSEEGFYKANDDFQVCAKFLQKETSAYYDLQEIVNEVYAVLVCIPYTGFSENSYQKQGEAAREIIRGVYGLFTGKGQEDLDALMERFQELEGVQEELGFDLTVLEEALYQLDQNHRKLLESTMTDKVLNVLLLCRSLLSDSLFIDFYEIKNDKPVDAERIKQVSDELTESLAEQLNHCDRMVARAIMAATLNKMPVFFTSHKEVMDYILYSLEKCTDKAEKIASMEIIQSIIFQ